MDTRDKMRNDMNHPKRTFSLLLLSPYFNHHSTELLVVKLGCLKSPMTSEIALTPFSLNVVVFFSFQQVD